MDGKLDSSAGRLNSSSLADLRTDLRRLVESVTGHVSLQDDEDFLAAGVDSLQVLALNRAIHKARGLDGGTGWTSGNALIYKNPTINSLAEALLKAGDSPTTNIVNVHDESDNKGTATVEKLIKKCNKFPGRMPSAKTAGHVVLLTGSTGSLGSYLLNELLSTETVREVWCLNRSPDAEERQKRIHEERGLPTDFAARHAFFWRASLAKEKLGLNDGTYSYLLENATHVIHTQWQVDFNLRLASFEPHIKGGRHLIDFSLQALQRSREVRLFFTSSVGVANNSTSTTPISEEGFNEYAIAGSGYGESKLVAETLLLEAGKKAGLNVTVARVGQIAGPVLGSNRGGQWNRKEWFRA